MCFSATASFSAAGMLAVAGAVTLSKAHDPKEWPLASVPLLFALQQGIEGMLWRTVPAGHLAGRWLATSFAILAMIVWPLFVPLAVGSAEKLEKRRPILALMGPGLGVAGYSVLDIWRHLIWRGPRRTA